MTGLYIHVPFCGRKCPYCDFYSVAAGAAVREAYVCAVERELHQRAGAQADTLYFGGGTPTLLTGAQFARLIAAARADYGLPDAEITAEANPVTLSPHMLEQLRRAGVNRLSIGVQSGVETELRALGRLHTPERAAQAVAAARQAGFSNLSVDLMLGIPGQTADSLRRTLDLVGALEVEHLSAYLLKMEPGTPFGQNPPPVPDDDAAADLYLQAVEGLRALGLLQYEISNFARPGLESRHNLKYWRQEEYLGFGPAAHSFVGGRRFAHSRDLACYLQQGAADVVLPDSGGGADEWLMLRLRLSKGITMDEAAARGLDVQSLQRSAGRLRQAGLAVPEQERLALTPKGMLVQSAIVLRLLKGQERELE